ncbi:MAG: NRDE family protein [Polyangiaceae bacterium]|jgi:uncharacterized protein with NRDE domain|nr:NRDE family protein [Polyangiaceae bacterium]MBK8939480.1 NRDE family protein [Polyangiaceae bacterium]
MCLLALYVAPHPTVRFVLAANRDEAFERPAAAAHLWADAPVLAGRDLRAGGTWLGAAAGGRVAALSNVRHPSARALGRSRGEIVRGFLAGAASAPDYARELAARASEFPSFNAFVGDASGALYLSEQPVPPTPLGPGVHAVSNGRLGDPWPKVERAKAGVAEAVRGDRVDLEALFAVLRDDRPAADHELPSTGVPLEIERALSPPFVRGPSYGTRCSTVVVVLADGQVELEERSFGPGGAAAGRVSASI